MHEKFPFNTIDDKALHKEAFNSNFSCKCQTTSGYCLEKSKYVFKFKISNSKKDTFFTNAVDINDQILNDFTIKPNFKYYQNHEFHKITNNLSNLTILVYFIPIYAPFKGTLKTFKF